ncbi:ATP-dependent RecD-like DNA helicase [Convivina intestini]|uniref:ATP-dependent RecD2 DNA helicase n=1 Tax=Convivina intestini TaxID=1505726 RepID=A0A2U1DFP5_9LACO|nr:ATP-dependent RecD-like DNA helicase [Convivina intestini]PVY86484.1 ATP-dependent DNA helicase (RecD/TraA family) [Convivina intestini]CAH1850060.1 ATP-dependent RecD-like DNA helicase [Convivina intestini]SDB84093.1 exodeoxyribonuclease V alpha subunit [Leuconostocaceae bacterium R-53105]
MTEQEEQLDMVSGTLQNIIFAASDSYFKILSVLVEDSTLTDWQEPEIIVTGTFADVQEGSVYNFYGDLVRHPKYGQQFKAQRYENELPPDENGLIKYLASGQFKGVGPKTAAKIVNSLGLNAIQLILDDPRVLAGMVKPALAQNLYRTLRLNLGLERFFQLGNQYGIGADLAGKLYDQYGDEAEDILVNHPYRFVFEFDGLSFKKIDQIAQKSGFQDNDGERMRAAVYAAMSALTFRQGHTYLTFDQLENATASLLRQPEAQQSGAIQTALDELISAHRVVVDQQRYYPKPLYDAEVTVAQQLKQLLVSPGSFPLNVDQVGQHLVVPDRIELDDKQQQAIQTGLASRLFVLTGGPGTGKTTIIKSMVATWQKLVQVVAQQGSFGTDWLKSQRVRLASPTGRAAKRMTEITGYEASTIHRLLGITDGGEAEFNADNPIAGGLLIVDEASMLDIELAAQLLSALPKDITLIFVGDSDQLPSVGPGNVLADMLASRVIPQVELDTIYRQGRGSSINALAADIKAGYLPQNFAANQGDRASFMVDGPQVPSAIYQVLEAAHKKGYSANEVQILTPMYKSEAGVNALNLMAQELFNPIKPGQKSLQHGQINFRQGDRVLQLENDSERDIYNGDMGQVIAVHYRSDGQGHEDSLVVDFDGKELLYPKKSLNQLTLAYATTVHKAQGNEFRLVIMVLTDQFYIMLNRNLLYTGITRAKEALIMVGNYSAFETAASRAVPQRQTSLVARLQDQTGTTVATKPSSPAPKTKPADKPLVTEAPPVLAGPAGGLNQATLRQASQDPLIGMTGTSPYDFMP